jgi:hypothetical protein
MWLYILIFGVICQFTGIGFYIKDTLAGSTKPNRVSWLMWAVAPMIATAAALSDGVTWAVLPVFMSGFGPFLVLLFSFFNKRSYWRLSVFDYICGLFSALALLLWGLTGNPQLAIFFAIAADLAAALPTILKSYKAPETESVGSYLSGVVGAGTSFFAVQVWQPTEYAFAVYLISVNIIIVSLIARKYKKNFRA